MGLKSYRQNLERRLQTQHDARMKRSPGLRVDAFAAVMMIAAMLIAIMASAISTDAWAAFFQHPRRQPLPEVTTHGALLWRVMLAVSAGALILSGLVLSSCRHDAAPKGSVEALSRKRLAGLTALVALGLVVRATRITESLWYDEIAAWLSYGAGVTSPGPIVGNYFDPVNHVFHTLLSWLSVNTLEPALGAEIAMRLPALVFSLLSIVAMHGLGRALGGNRVGWFAAIIAAVAPVSVLEAVEARGYSMMIFFSAAATWLLVEARSRRHPWLWVAYAGTTALGAWAHFVTVFVPIGHAAWLAWWSMRTHRSRDDLCAFTGLGLAAVLSLTPYAPIIPEMLSTRAVFFSSRGDEPSILGPEGFHAMLQLGGSWCWWAAIPGLVMFCTGVAALGRKRQWDVLAITMIGLPLMILVVWASGSWLYARFTLFALPGAMLLMAVGLNECWRWRRNAALVGLLILIAAWVGDLRLRPSKQPLREAAEIVRQNSSRSERVLVIGLAHEVMRVYLSDRPLTYSLRLGRDLQASFDAIDPDWVIVEYPDHVGEPVFELLDQRGFKMSHRLDGWVDWGRGDVLVLERR